MPSFFFSDLSEPCLFPAPPEPLPSVVEVFSDVPLPDAWLDEPLVDGDDE